MRNYMIPLIIFAAALFTSIGACQLTPTIMPAPTATVDPQDIVPLPQLGIILSTLSEHYESFSIATSWGLAPDTLVYIGFESPVGSGSLHVAVYAWADGHWALVDVVDVDGVPQAQKRRNDDQ